MWSAIFLSSKLTEIIGNLSWFQFIENQQTIEMFNSAVNFKDTRKVHNNLKTNKTFNLI